MGRTLGGLFVPPFRAGFTIFLLGLGLLALQRLSGEAGTLRTLFALPRRPSDGREWALGVALAWAAVVASLLPLLLSRSLTAQLWLEPRAWVAAAMSLVGAAIATLAIEVAFRSFALRRLTAAFGPTWATIGVSLLYAALAAPLFGSAVAFWSCFLFSCLLSLGWHRTRAVWLPWGLHFGWNAALGLLFGLPTFDGGDLSSIVQSQAAGRLWTAGRGLGPVNDPWTWLVLLVTIAVLIRSTRDYAWHYTHSAIEPAGYPMDVPAPAAHTAMAAAPPPPLVQIGTVPPPPVLPSRDLRS